MSSLEGMYHFSNVKTLELESFNSNTYFCVDLNQPCNNPANWIELSGSNDDNATNLQACIGECDSDDQCATGLKCCHRNYGETIRGCKGGGGGPDSDYCCSSAAIGPNLSPSITNLQLLREFEVWPFTFDGTLQKNVSNNNSSILTKRRMNTMNTKNGNENEKYER